MSFFNAFDVWYNSNNIKKLIARTQHIKPSGYVTILFVKEHKQTWAFIDGVWRLLMELCFVAAQSATSILVWTTKQRK